MVRHHPSPPEDGSHLCLLKPDFQKPQTGVRAESRHSSQMPGAEFAPIYPKENQSKEEEGAEEAREDKRSKRRKMEARRHPWAKQGKQETKKTSWRLVGATGHTVPTATSFPQPLLSQIPTSSRTVSPASPHPAPATSST